MKDDATYGFNKQDAHALVESIGMDETTSPLRQPSGGGGGNAQFKFFKLDAAVVDEVEITGLASTYNGTTTGDPVTLINWEGLLDDAPEDYIGLFVQVDGDWVFVQGLCIFPP